MAPGLVKREIIERNESYVVIRETWDLRVPGCPMVAVRFDPLRGAGDAEVCVREIYEPRGEVT